MWSTCTSWTRVNGSGSSTGSRVGGRRPTVEEQKYILGRLNSAEAFETFLQTKYIGQKRFSLEGGETVIPLLDAALAKAAELRHRRGRHRHGAPRRLNVLANIVGKPYSQIFREFEGNMDPRQTQGSGDVKYHLGAEGKYIPPSGRRVAGVTLVANPSHLEVVDPVLEGVARAKQDQSEPRRRGFTVMPIAMHGDAAFAGQGVVAETLQLSQLRGYRTGGTLHVIINNQVGFTTAPEASRSVEYCTDVAKMVQAPIFHVNGDDPEAAVWVARLAVRIPADVRPGCSHRHDLLSPARAQRGRRPVDDQPVDVPDHRRQTLRPPALHRGTDRPRRSRPERGRRIHAGLPQQLDRVFNEVRELEKAVATASPSVETRQPVPSGVETTITAKTLQPDRRRRCRNSRRVSPRTPG